jgi:alkyl hydroperoxide reductase subunit AhpF
MRHAGEADAMTQRETYDAIVVGSGISGGWARSRDSSSHQARRRYRTGSLAFLKWAVTQN